VSLAVNVSPLLLAAGAVSTLLQSVPPERVVVELTEHIAIQDYCALSQMVEQLRANGARLAVDDTGAGISSLAHILSLRPDIIKLDRFLVSGVDTDPARRALAVALVGFASEIGAGVVAEGIETEGELNTLRALGIVLGQGFFLGRPCPVSTLFPVTAEPKKRPAHQHTGKYCEQTTPPSTRTTCHAHCKANGHRPACTGYA